jgi:pyruvate kinase
MTSQTDTDNFINHASSCVVSSGLLKEGDLVVLSAGYPVGGTGSTNTLQIQILGHIFLRGKGVGKSNFAEGKLILCHRQEDMKILSENDIIAVKRCDIYIRNVINKIKGLIIADENISPEEYRFLSDSSIPVIIGVPGIFKSFSSGDFVKIDVKRGIVYK